MMFKTGTKNLKEFWDSDIEKAVQTCIVHVSVVV